MPSGVYFRTEQNRINIGLAKKGTKNPCSKEKAEKIRLSQLGKLRPQTSGEKHYLWKGNNCNYRSLHKWVERHLGKPIKCEHCGKEKTTPKSIQWANKSHLYLRELTDWISLCVKCHKHYDGYGIEN